MWTDLYFRLRSLFRRQAVEADLDDELLFHFEEAVEKMKRSGLSEADARRQARLLVGSHEVAKEECRDARGTRLIESFLHDLRFGLRLLLKSPGFFVIATLTLALGVGASTAVFSLVNTVLLKPSPYPNAARVIMPWRLAQLDALSSTGDDAFPWNPAEFAAFSQSVTIFRNLGIFKRAMFNLTGNDTPEFVEAVYASAGFFQALGEPARIGRVFSQDEDRPGHEHVAVLSDHFWRTKFNADPAVLNRTMTLDGAVYTIIGVMPPGFRFPDQVGIRADLGMPRETRFWVPLALTGATRGPSEMAIVGEVKPGTSPSQIQLALEAAERRIEEQNPEEKNWRTIYFPLEQQATGAARRPLLLFLAAVSVVLLVACANVAGLMLNRSLGRRRELALRAALGAESGRLVRQFLTESLLLSFVGGLLGLAVAAGLIRFVKLFGPSMIPHLEETAIDWRVLIYALGTVLLTAILFGLAPAMSARRLDLVDAFKDGAQRTGASQSSSRLRNALLIAQISLAMILAVASGLLVRTFTQMLRTESGFRANRVLTFELPLPPAQYPEISDMERLYRRALARLSAIPGIDAIGLTSIVPMGGGTDSTVIRLPDRPPQPSGQARPYANYSFVSPGYFHALGATLLQGRDFSNADTLDAPHVTVINQAMANRYWHGQNPVGKQVGVAATRYPVRTIVGVVANIKHGSLREDPAPEMFVPFMQSEIKAWPSMREMQFAVRTAVDPASMSASLREAIREVDPALPLAKFGTLQALVDDSAAADGFAVLLITAFGAVALLLAAVGIYGVISYSVAQRIPEIGVRLALGASRWQILRGVLTQGVRLTAIGIVVGTGGAFASTRLISRFLYGVSSTDPVTFIAVALLLATVTLLACYVPARRAMKVDPMIALRYE